MIHTFEVETKQKCEYNKADGGFIMKNISAAIISDIKKYLDSDLVSFYDTHHTKSKNYDNSLFDLIMYLVMSEILDKDPGGLSKLMTLKMRSRTTKKNRYLKRCKNDIDTRLWETPDDLDKFFAKNKVYAYNALNSEQRETVYAGKSLLDIINDEYKIVELWAKDSQSKMIDYPGADKITARNQYCNFESDLIINILQIIKDQYHSDLSSQTVTYLDYLGDKSIFSATRTQYPINKNGVTQIAIQDPNDSNVKTIITYDGTVDGSFVTLLDMLDINIISYFINRTIQADAEQRSFLIAENELVKAVLLKNGVNRIITKTDRERVNTRIAKLQHIKIDVYKHGVHQQAYGLVGDTSPVKLNGIKYIEYFPSLYITKQVEEGLITRLPTYVRDQLNNEAAKLLYMPLMQQRYRIYRMIRCGTISDGDYKMVLRRLDFSKFLNFYKCSVRMERDLIEGALTEYVNKKIFIKDFSYSRVNDEYTLEFFKLSDMEISDIEYVFYNQDPEKISTMIVGNVISPCIIDTSQVPVTDTNFIEEKQSE